MEKVKCEICGTLTDDPIEFICFRFGKRYFDTCNGRVRKITIMCKNCFRRIYNSYCIKCRFNWRPGLPDIIDVPYVSITDERDNINDLFHIKKVLHPIKKQNIINQKRAQVSSSSILCFCTGYIWTLRISKMRE